jgi:adenylate cyclase
VFHERDGSFFLDGDYVIKGVPGRILFAILREHEASGRSEFTNRELRLDRSIGLPAGKDNLESRLLALRRRLAERDGPIRLERTGRGRLRVDVDQPLRLTRRDD